MLCAICWQNLRGQDGRIWKGTYDLHFRQDLGIAQLTDSAQSGCSICKPIYGLYEDRRRSLICGKKEEPTSINASRPSLISINASLSVVDQHDGPELYRLDYTLQQDKVRVKQTFILQEISFEHPPIFTTPWSQHTGSDECFDLAAEWIKNCNDHHDCYPKNKNSLYYPTRLIDLSPLKPKTVEMKNSKQPSLSGNLGAGTTKKPVLRQHGDIINTKLKLVLGSEVQKEASDRYVTLSHCWGNPQQEGYVTPPRLTREMLSTYCREGVRIGDLTLTFRQAIEFAARITSVRYIWIDSLCIVQSDMEEWIRESREMFHVYSESYLNISATASSNSNGGLYRHRQRSHLWEDEVSLNIAGLPGARVASRGTTRSAELLLQPGHDAGIMKREGVSLERSETDPGCLFSIYHGLWRQIPSRRRESSKSLKRQERLVPTGVQASPTNPSHAFPAQGGSLRRCVLIDASRWEKLVNAAPVNTRGWVLQERLMAPRVLHFCSDQIAWECKRCDLYESQARGVPNFQLKYDEIVPDERVKALELEDGRLLRNQRLQGALDPDEALEHVYAFEIWARIVEMYSRTAITKPEDKLIALSGIAQMMADKMTDPKDGSTPTYIAGLWGKHLASQLLWRVEPVFHANDRSFEILAQRSPIYRAPSFSWAALDAHKGTGIIYGEVTDKDLLIRADERSISIQPSDEHNPFGAVKGGAYIRIRGKPQSIVIVKKTDRMGKPTGRFGWLPKDKKNTDDKEHTNVYLDCPGSDAECSGIIEKTDTYHLPVAMGPRTARFESKYIFCLLLQEVRERVDGLLGHGAKTLRRVGLSKLSPWGDRRAYEHITKSYGIFEDGVTGEIGKTSMVPRRYGQWDLDSGSEEFYLV